MLYHDDLAGRPLTVPEAIAIVQKAGMVLICDDEGRENEADICLAAQFATSERINFLLRNVCGLVCVAMAGERLDALRIPLLEQTHYPLQGPPFTISVDSRH